MQPPTSEELQDPSVVTVFLDWVDLPISTAEKEALVLGQGRGL